MLLENYKGALILSSVLFGCSATIPEDSQTLTDLKFLNSAESESSPVANQDEIPNNKLAEKILSHEEKIIISRSLEILEKEIIKLHSNYEKYDSGVAAIQESIDLGTVGLNRTKVSLQELKASNVISEEQAKTFSADLERKLVTLVKASETLAIARETYKESHDLVNSADEQLKIQQQQIIENNFNLAQSFLAQVVPLLNNAITLARDQASPNAIKAGKEAAEASEAWKVLNQKILDLNLIDN